MAANIQAAVATGSIPLRDELLARYSVSILDLLKLPGMGPKTVALLWDASKISSVDQLAEAIDAGRLAGLPRMGEKQIEKLRKGIEDFRKSVGRFRIDEAEESADRIIQYLLAFDGGVAELPASRQPAPCVAAVRRQAIWICWLPAPLASRTRWRKRWNIQRPIPASAT